VSVARRIGEGAGKLLGEGARLGAKATGKLGLLGVGAAWKLKEPLLGYTASQGHLGVGPQAAMMFAPQTKGMQAGATAAGYKSLYDSGADYRALRGGVGVSEHNKRDRVSKVSEGLEKASMFGFGRRKNRRRRGNNQGSGGRSGPKNSPKSSGDVKKYKFKPMDSLKQNATGAFGKSIGAIGAAGAIGATVYGAHHLYKKMKGEDRWSQLTSRYPELNTKSDRDNYNILLEYAPSLTLQPRVAGSYLIRAKEQHLMPHEFIKDLVDIESKRSRTPVSFGSGFAGRVMK